MITKKLIATVAIVSLLAVPAMAQTTKKENGGHHYTGGPKTGVPHHMGKKGTVSPSKDGASGDHHYSGGPKTVVPHHMGAKK